MNSTRTPKRLSHITIKTSTLLFSLVSLFFLVGLAVAVFKPSIKKAEAVVAKSVASEPKKEVLAASYAYCPKNVGDFTDVPAGHQNEEAIYAMARCCVLVGKTASNFGANDNITRAEVAYLIARYHRHIRGDWQDAPAGAHYFKDVNPANYPPDGVQYNLIQTNKFNEFLVGLSSPTSTNCPARFSSGPYIGKYQFYSNYNNPANQCELDANGLWTFGFHGITRSPNPPYCENWNGIYNFCPGGGPISYPSGQRRADYVQQLYDYFKANSPDFNSTNPLAVCLRNESAECTITAGDCEIIPPATTCKSSVSWSSQYASDIAIYRDGETTPVGSGASGTNQLYDITQGPHTFYCRNNGQPLAQDNATATLAPTYNVSGVVYYDKNNNKVRDLLPVPEPLYTNSSFTITNNRGGTPLTTSANPYQFSGILAGSVTITFNTTLPDGYSMTVPPMSGLGASFTVSALGTCPTTPNPIVAGNLSLDVRCDPVTKHVTNLNFGITDSFTWSQFTGLDVREDTGFASKPPKSIDPMCSEPAASGQGRVLLSSTKVVPALSPLSQTSGLLFTNATPSWFGDSNYGTLSQNRWIIADSAQKYSKPPLTISYLALKEAQKQTNLPVNNLSCPGQTCPSLNASGIYIVDAGTPPATPYFIAPQAIQGSNPDGKPKQIILLINGSVTLQNSIRVQNGNIFILASTGDITVDPSLGQDTLTCDVEDVPNNLSANAAVLQGIFATDGNFTVPAQTNVCTGTIVDKMLFIDGTVVTNADLSTGGTFSNTRNLCEGNLNFPSVVIRQRPDFIVNLPNFVKNQKIKFRELSP